MERIVCIRFLALSMILALSACEPAGETMRADRQASNDKDVAVEQLTATTWSLTQFSGRPVDIKAKERRPWIEFVAQDSHVQGFGGCNQFGGDYERDGKSLRIGPIASTKMACIGAMETESRLFEALRNTRSFSIANGELILFDADGDQLAGFRAGAAKDSKVAQS